MCLKYFVGYSACDHHEYLGSHHCSSEFPCSLDEQHFHYIEDNFPVPWPASLQEQLPASQRALACNICAKQYCEELSPEQQPVEFYAPTNDFPVKESWPTGYNLPVTVVRAKAQDVSAEYGGIEGSDDHREYDYKSLSAVDEDEWDTRGAPGQTTSTHADSDQHAMLAHRGSIQDQLKDLPSYLAQRRQNPLLAPPMQWLEAYAMEGWSPYTMPHMTHPSPFPALPLPLWHGGMQFRSPVSAGASPRPEDCSPLLMPSSPGPRGAATPATPAVQPQRPATPPSTPPVHPLPPRPAPTFIVGSITDAYLRMEAAKRRHMRERSRRARPSWPDALPTRTMALTDFVVSRRSQKAHHKDMRVAGIAGDIEADAWSSLPFAGEESDAEGGAEEYAGVPEVGKATYRFSCRLFTLM